MSVAVDEERLAVAAVVRTEGVDRGIKMCSRYEPDDASLRRFSYYLRGVGPFRIRCAAAGLPTRIEQLHREHRAAGTG